MDKTMTKRIGQFVPTELSFDESQLGRRDREVLSKLVEASRFMDDIFLRQVSPHNPQWRARLEASSAARDKELLHYFRIMYGPWDRLDQHRPFMGDEKKPLGAGFYPPDLTRDEFEEWLARHPEDDEAFTSYYTVIERDGDRLVAEPYAEAYREFLEPAAKLLEEAAEISDNASLSRFLRSRAGAFRTNQYFQSDVDWVDIEDSLIDVTIGPYEVYEDRLLGYKAAFEAFIGIKDPRESGRLEKLIAYLPELEANLPGADEYAPMARGESSPISVVSQVFCSGESRAGGQAGAFILPNDEQVRWVKGSKKVMLKNVMEAKFRTGTAPTARRILAEEQQSLLDFDTVFNIVLLHELAHGLGPGLVTNADGSQTTVSLALKEQYPTLEEAKADLAGMCGLFYLIGKGVLSDARRACVNHVVTLFRSIRFGIDEAHGRAALLQLNWLLEAAGLLHDKNSGRFLVDCERTRESLAELTRRVLLLQAEGSYGQAREFLDTYGVLTPPMEVALARMVDLPVDIEPIFPLESMMRGW
ncbi:MAG: peptidase [Anaerolineae bacterium]|nr:peptidase [Anaerolineae bacterium]